MDRVANDLARFDEDAQAFTSLCKTFRASCELLHDEMNALQSMWTGEAHDAMSSRFAGDYEDLLSLLDYAEGVSRGLHEAYREYDQGERSVASAIDAITV